MSDEDKAELTKYVRQNVAQPFFDGVEDYVCEKKFQEHDIRLRVTIENSDTLLEHVHNDLVNEELFIEMLIRLKITEIDLEDEDFKYHLSFRILNADK